MRFLRGSFFCSSSAASMSALFAVAAISFTARVTFADGGPASPSSCTSEEVTTCSDAGAQQACACTNGDCACVQSRCDDHGTQVTALACTPIVTCALYPTEACDGKSEGDACGTSSGTCAPADCPTLIDGVYTTVQRLACRAPYNDGELPGASSSDDEGDVSSGGSKSAPRQGSSSPSYPAGDSGCSVARGLLGTSELLAGAPLGLLAFAALRRRRR